MGTGSRTVALRTPKGQVSWQTLPRRGQVQADAPTVCRGRARFRSHTEGQVGRARAGAASYSPQREVSG